MYKLLLLNLKVKKSWQKLAFLKGNHVYST